ncbi:hypothetical protein ACWEIM_29915 [Streptomyces sp. NPDC004778]
MTDTTPTPADRPADQLRAAVWVDGDPLMEAIAAAVYEQCDKYPEVSVTIDDPRTIAAVAATVARQLLGTNAAEGTAEDDAALGDGAVRCPLCPDTLMLHTPSGARAHFAHVHPEQQISGHQGPWPVLVDAAPLAEVWTVWRDDDTTTYAHYATADDARQGTIDCWQEDEPSCPDYSWRKVGPNRLELVVGGVHAGVYASRHRVYGAPPAPADRAALEALAAEWEKRGRYGDSSITDRARELRAVLAADAAADFVPEAVAAATHARECLDRPAVIRWCANRVRSTDGDYTVQAAADYLDDLATEIDEAADAAAGVQPPTSEARTRIADALAKADGWNWGPSYDMARSPSYQEYLRQADVALAALAAPPAAPAAPEEPTR